MKSAPTNAPPLPLQLAEAGETYDPEAFNRALGHVIKHVREILRGMSLHEAERRSGVDRHHWRDVEAGKKALTVCTQIKVCQALRILPSTLYALAENHLLFLRDTEPSA